MSMRKGLGVFLFLTLGVSIFIVLRSVDKAAIKALLHMKKTNILYALLLVVASWCQDALRFCFTARAMGYKIALWRGLTLTWLHYFGCAITPMQVGGGPFQVYALYKSGVPVGAGIAITLVRTLFSTFLLSIAAPTAFFLVPQLHYGGAFLRGVFYYIATVAVFMWIVFILSVIKSDAIKSFCGRVILMLKRVKYFRNLHVVSLYSGICREIDSYSDNLRRMVGAGKFWFLAAFLISIFQLATLFSVLPLLMRAIHLHVNWHHAVLAQAMFMFLLYFIPTPGASGVAEGGGASVFSLLMPANMTGIMAVLWRFFTEYLAIFMGCIVAIRMIGWGTAERIINCGQDDVINKERTQNEG